MHRALFLTKLVLVVAAVVGVAAFLHDRHVRPTVPKVAAVALREPKTRALPAGLPDFSARGWRAVGGRSDEIGGRTVVTARYERGNAIVTYSRMADTKGLNDGTGTLTRSWGRLWLSWQDISPWAIAARGVLGGHQVVLVGRPGSRGLRREMTRLAALASPSGTA